jgi:hypothetical protein
MLPAPHRGVTRRHDCGGTTFMIITGTFSFGPNGPTTLFFTGFKLLR